MNERPSLRDVLSEIAGDVRPADLSERVAGTSKRLRRQRSATAALAVVAVVGAGGFAWSQAPLGSDAEQSPGGRLGTPAPGTTASCCVITRGVAVTPGASPSVYRYFANTPQATSPVGSYVAPTPSAAGATARPPSATPPESVPSGHGCSSPWTDESSGNGSPFASSAQREQAAAMGTALCGHLGKATVTQLVEWISMGGLNQVTEGVTYDVQASGNGTAVYLEIFHRSDTSPGTTPVVTTESGALRAQWPDGTVVLMTKGVESPVTRQIVTDPAFDAFHG